MELLEQPLPEEFLVLTDFVVLPVGAMFVMR
jgi:hypothetical protein